MRFFHLNFLNVGGIFAKKIYNACAIFRQFFDVENGGRSQQQSVLGQLVSGKRQSCPKES